MQFTGKNLQLIRDALDLAHNELHNQIATCPDVIEYCEDIDSIENQRAEIDKLINRIDKKINTCK